MLGRGVKLVVVDRPRGNRPAGHSAAGSGVAFLCFNADYNVQV